MTHDRLLETVDYSPESGDFQWKQSRSGRRAGVFGVIEKNGYSRVCIDGERYLLHRLAWFHVTGKMPADQIDHINLDKQDNRFCNLREATCSENNRNVGVSFVNTSGYKDIWYESDRKKFRVGVKGGGRIVYAGRHDTIDSAIIARDALIERLHGEFARVH